MNEDHKDTKTKTINATNLTTKLKQIRPEVRKEFKPYSLNEKVKLRSIIHPMDSSPIAMKSKNIRACQNAKMERKLYDWICMKQKIGVPLSGQIIMEKAKEIFKD